MFAITSSSIAITIVTLTNTVIITINIVNIFIVVYIFTINRWKACWRVDDGVDPDHEIICIFAAGDDDDKLGEWDERI